MHGNSKQELVHPSPPSIIFAMDVLQSLFAIVDNNEDLLKLNVIWRRRTPYLAALLGY